MKLRHALAAAAITAALAARLFAGTATISIDASKKGAQISPRMYGIFLEEINHGVDGGWYAEMVRNRAFEENNPPEGTSANKDNRFVTKAGWDTGFQSDPTGLPFWHVVLTPGANGTATLTSEAPLNGNTPHSLCLKVEKVGTGARFGISNEGYWGFNIVKSEKYNLSLNARCATGFTGPLTVTLEDAKGVVKAKPVVITGIGPQWKEFKAVFTGTETDSKARLVIAAGSKGTVWIDVVSLMPAKTWKNLPLRPDISQMIADLKPGFVRFPGGCVVEGGNPETAYNWKDTVGRVSNRLERWNCWGYRRTHGIGLYEYLQFCEDVNATPLFVLFAGESCYFRLSERVPMDKMGWVDANYLDAIEFAQGPATSTWGSIRARMGHPKAFPQMMIGIGNENWLEEYVARYKPIYKSLKDKYPQITTVACVEPNGVKVDMVDHHYYRSPRWFWNTNENYDSYDRKKAPVYIGEISTYSRETHGGYNLVSGLSEAAYMLNLERNADVVRMVSYAPLLANVDGRTGWHGCINFDSSRVFGTPSYYVQKMFSNNVPSCTVASDVKSEIKAAETVPGLVNVECIQLVASVKDVKVEKDGKILYQSDFSQSTSELEKSPQWKVNADALETADYGFFQLGDPAWEDYTVSLKMKYTKGLDQWGGAFILRSGVSPMNSIEWKIDNHGKASHVNAVDDGYGNAAVDVQDGAWHEMKMEVKGPHVRCLLDGKVVHDYTFWTIYKFAANAGLDSKTGEVVVKVVNGAPEAMTTTLNLSGLPNVLPQSAVTTLTAKKLTDENTLENPKNVAPVASTFTGAGKSFTYTFAPNSLTVMRLKTK